jgi:hypothetical protein
MGEMTTVWKTETHKTVIRLNKGGQSSEAVGKTS